MAENTLDDTIHDILKNSHVIAVVGLSNDTSRPSYGVARYMQQQGYTIVPVTPKADEVLGERAYHDLLSVPFDVDIVNIFRRSETVGPHVEEAIQKGAKTVWMQLGIRNDEAAEQARTAGLHVITDLCIKIEHSRVMR